MSCILTTKTNFMTSSMAALAFNLHKCKRNVKKITVLIFKMAITNNYILLNEMRNLKYSKKRSLKCWKSFSITFYLHSSVDYIQY